MYDIYCVYCVSKGAGIIIGINSCSGTVVEKQSVFFYGGAGGGGEGMDGDPLISVRSLDVCLKPSDVRWCESGCNGRNRPTKPVVTVESVYMV